MYLLCLTFILSILHFHIFYKHIPHKLSIHTLTYIFLIYLTNTISHKTYIFLTISIHLKRYQTPFQEHIIKALLMEGNITYILLKTKRASSRGISFKCMIMRTNLTNICTRLDIFSLPPVAPVFPLQSWSYHERTHNIIPHPWTHFIIQLKYYKFIDVIWLEPQTTKWNVISSLKLYGWSHKPYKVML